MIDDNPKTQFGIKKPPTWHVPFTGVFTAALAHLHGALKYGSFNWREEPVSASTYMDAAIRHIQQWKEGEEQAKDSGVHHLGHAIACLNILVDAQNYGTLIDDRTKERMDYDEFFDKQQPTIKRLYDEWGPK